MGGEKYMIIGYDFFGVGMDGNVFDTPIPTAFIDEVTLGAGIYDEMYVTVDTDIGAENVRPKNWQLKTIMNAKFETDLEAGSLDSDGHVITVIQIYRRKHLIDDDWLIVGQFDYDTNFNVYSFVDRFTENGAEYEYAIVPVAKDVIGDITVSEPIDVEYDGVFLSDLDNNYKMEVDFETSSISHNNNVSTSSPLNGRFPIVTQGNQDYQSGQLTFLPLSPEQVRAGGTTIDGKSERAYRNQVLDFLKNGKTKVIRNDNGEMTIVATHNVRTDSKNGSLADLSSISFDFIELGDFDFDTMSKAGLLGKAGKSKYTFDEFGNIIWAMNFDDEGQKAIREHRNSFPKVVDKL